MPQLNPTQEELLVEPVKPAGFFPVITTEKLEECHIFYQQHFGFKVIFECDWYIHLATDTGIQLGFLQPNQPRQPAFLQRAYSGEGIIFSFEVEKIDEEYKKLSHSGVPILFPLTTEDWGQRHFMTKDPSGMIIDIIQATEPTDEYKDHYCE